MPHTFAKIGLHLDLRVQVPPLPALQRIAADAASFGLNTLIVEWEATFPFRKHAVLSNQYAYQPAELEVFLRFCTRQGLDVIPLQQCFGHLEYLLQHPRYAHLRESDTDLCQLCPCRVDEAVPVFREIFAEVAAAHPSPYLHIGGDETYLLGHCPACREVAAREGASRLYVAYFKRVAAEVLKLGKRPLLWADMLLKYPDAAREMPRECIFIDWNYGWPVNRFGDFSRLTSLPFEFWGAVAMRSAPDNHSNHAWKTHLDNFRDYIPIARERRFQGMILTSWSTSGIYGYEWDRGGHPTALHPVRRTTPHVGLRVLMAVFAEGARESQVLDPENSVVRYARERFGLTETEATSFFHSMLLGDLATLKWDTRIRLFRAARKARKILRELHPSGNHAEFERYCLMTDFLCFQLKVSGLEDRVQSIGDADEDLPRLLRRIESTLTQAASLNRLFLQAYAGELHPEELQEEIDYRMKALRRLQTRVSRGGRIGKGRPAAWNDNAPPIISPVGEIVARS